MGISHYDPNERVTNCLSTCENPEGWQKDYVTRPWLGDFQNPLPYPYKHNYLKSRFLIFRQRGKVVYV